MLANPAMPPRGNVTTHPAVTAGIVAVCLAAAIGITSLDAVMRREMVGKLSAIHLSDVPPHSLPISPGAIEEDLLLPGSSMDARWWVLHTRAMLDADGWRVRETSLDNAPAGREVHWSSLLVWVLAVTAKFLSIGSGKAPQEFVAEAALFAGPILGIAFLLGLSGIVLRRFGLIPAAFFALVFLTSYPIARAFQAGEADHHGIVLGFAAATLLCLVAGGSGFSRAAKPGRSQGLSEMLTQKDSERWFAISGVLGAAALWVSAATAIPILFGVGVGALATALLARELGKGTVYDPRLWLTWGKSGCLASLGFYALEYFPNHMGWRLEVNHPLYAVAWLGGAFLLKMATASISDRKLPPQTPKSIIFLVLAMAALIAPVGLIACCAGQVFWVSDRFLLALHNKCIFEFQSLPKLIQVTNSGLQFLTYYPWPFLAGAGALLLTILKGWTPFCARAFCLVLPPTVFMQALSIYQVRWASASFAMWSVCALLIFLNYRGDPARPGSLWIHRLALGTCILAVVTQLLQLGALVNQNENCTKAPIAVESGNSIILRDIAHRLIQSSPTKLPTVLSGPNSSTDLSFHGGIQTIGTLYWENMPGLKRAARIFAAPDEASALQALEEASVTHIVVPSWDNFSDSYSRLIKLEDPQAGDSTYFQSILKGEECPKWLRPFAYPIPSESGLQADSVRIFAVIPEQNAFEAAYFRGIFYFESGDFKRADQIFREAASLRPGDLRITEYLKKIPPGFSSSPAQ